jgi:hypothetical protein
MKYSITIHTPIGWCFFARMVSVSKIIEAATTVIALSSGKADHYVCDRSF